MAAGSATTSWLALTVASRWNAVPPCLCFDGAEHVRRADRVAVVWFALAGVAALGTLACLGRAVAGTRLAQVTSAWSIVLAAVTIGWPPIPDELVPSSMAASLAVGAAALAFASSSVRAATEHDRRRAEQRLARIARAPVTF